MSPPPNPPPLGIELGADFCRVAVVENGAVRVFNSNGDDKVRSTFFTRSPTEPAVIGQSHLNIVPDNYVIDACQQLAPAVHETHKDACWYATRSQTGEYTTAHGSYKQGEVLTALIRHLKSNAARELKMPDATKLTDAVIAVPAYSTNNYRRMLVSAAKDAGFKRIQLVNQSTAAVISFKYANYAHDALVSPQPRVLGVISAGAKSFEASVFVIDVNGGVHLLSTSGSATLGGRDLTDEMCRGVMEKLRTAPSEGRDQGRFDSKDYINEVWHACEKAKGALADFKTTTIKVEVHDESHSFPFDQKALAALPTAKRMLQLLTEGIKIDLNLSEVLMIGGSSRLPFLATALKRLAPTAKLTTNVPIQEAVIHGTALHSQITFNTGAPGSWQRVNCAFSPDFAYNGVFAVAAGGARSCLVKPTESQLILRLGKVIASESGELITKMNLKHGYALTTRLNDCGMVEVKEVKLPAEQIAQNPSKRVTFADQLEMLSLSECSARSSSGSQLQAGTSGSTSHKGQPITLPTDDVPTSSAVAGPSQPNTAAIARQPPLNEPQTSQCASGSGRDDDQQRRSVSVAPTSDRHKMTLSEFLFNVASRRGGIDREGHGTSVAPLNAAPTRHDETQHDLDSSGSDQGHAGRHRIVVISESPPNLDSAQHETKGGAVSNGPDRNDINRDGQARVAPADGPSTQAETQGGTVSNKPNIGVVGRNRRAVSVAPPNPAFVRQKLRDGSVSRRGVRPPRPVSAGPSRTHTDGQQKAEAPESTEHLGVMTRGRKRNLPSRDASPQPTTKKVVKTDYKGLLKEQIQRAIEAVGERITASTQMTGRQRKIVNDSLERIRITEHLRIDGQFLQGKMSDTERENMWAVFVSALRKALFPERPTMPKSCLMMKAAKLSGDFDEIISSCITD